MEKKVHIYGLVTASNEAVQRSRLTGPEVLTSVLDHPHIYVISFFLFHMFG